MANLSGDLVHQETEIEVSFKIKLPQAATLEQIKAWLRYSLNDTGCLPGDNPLSGESVEPIFGTLDFKVKGHEY